MNVRRPVRERVRAVNAKASKAPRPPAPIHVADGAGPPSAGLISALLALMDKHRPTG